MPPLPAETDATLSRALESAGRMAFVHDTERDHFQLHGAVQALTGREPGAITCMAEFLAVLHPDDRALISQGERLGAMLQEGFDTHFRVVHPNGHIVACETCGDLFGTPAGPNRVMTGIISPAQKSRRLLDQVMRLADLTEYLPELVSVHSTDGRTVSINSGGRKLLGIDRGEDVSRLLLSDLFGDSSTAPAHLLLSVVLAHGSHASEVILRNLRDGRQMPAHWSATVINEPELDQRFVVCIARDMTHQLETEWELRENQRRLTHALDVSQLGEWSMDINTQTGRQSQRVSDIFGEGVSEEWNYKVFLSHVHPDDRGQVEHLFSRSLDTARDLDFEARIIRRDGGHRWISAKASMTRGLRGDGQIIGGVIQDITDRKFTETRNRLLADLSRPLAALLDEGRMLREVVQLIVPLLADHMTFDVFGKDGLLVREISTNSLLSRGAIGDPKTSVERLPELSARAMSSGRTVALNVSDGRELDQVARTDSEVLSLRGLDVRAYLCVPLRVRERPVGFLHLYRLSTELRFSEAECNLVSEIGLRVAVALENARLYRALRESDTRKDEFLAMLSHELRNPLESLDAGVSLFEHEGEEQPPSSATSVMMRRQISKLSSLLDDLLDVSRYSIDKVFLRRTVVELQPLLKSVVEEYRSRKGASDYSWTLDLPENTVLVHADAVRLSQVIDNLLSNAMRYGESRGTISVELRVENEKAHIIVGDDGVGMSADQLSSVFDLFVQGATTIDRSHGGLGMGLTLVRKIVELHGGEVEAHSEGLGRGSRISVVLSTTPAEDRSLKSKPAPLSRAQGERLLLVDDNVDTVGALSKLFVRLGYDVRVAHDGKDAITLAKEFQPRLAVLDIGLPGANGYEVAEALRSDCTDDPLLLVALSGYGQKQDRERSNEAGFDHHLLKPVDFSTIARLLENSLQGQ